MLKSLKVFKRLCYVFLIATFIAIGFQLTNNKAATATNDLQVMTSSSGVAYTYRYSSEKVYGLKEYDNPVNDLRACWVSNFAGDIASYTTDEKFKSDYTAILDNMESWGLNTIVFHIRTHNNAMYKSLLNPKASFWANVDFNRFDPLEWAITETHKRGMEFHAWMNPYRINDTYVNGSYPEGNPANDSNNILVGSKGGSILDPGLPNVREFIVDTCMEVIKNYDVDAINFDDYFYIDECDDTDTRAKYNTEGLSIDDFRRKQVDLFIESLSKSMRANNELTSRCVQLGIAPTGIYENGSYVSSPTYNSNGDLISPIYSNTAGYSHYGSPLFCDTVNWINHEWIDYIMPQAYWGMEKNVAHFYELTRFWSWAVHNKKVNLYMGCGVYMALENSGDWNNNPQEMLNQILNSSMYDEIKGLCYYKYASLKSTSNTVINNGKATFSKLWSKKIPSAVSLYYKDKVSSVVPTNVIYDTTNQTMSWDTISNVRGYMVYRCAKGTSLDNTNIENIYSYQTTNSIKITQADLEKYDFYVASVNYANEYSNAQVLTSEATGETVKNLISYITQPITLAEQSLIESIRSLYNKLSDVEKVKVTNYDVLVASETSIAKLLLMKEEVDTFLSSVSTHVTTNYVLPTKANMTWSYKVSSDSLIYNITSGTRLKNYLNIHLIPLELTYTTEGYTYTQDVSINIGLLKTTETGLFYRNDASSVGENDEGSYTPGSASYIGWANASITYNNSVLFIAEGNYHEVTDASTITQCHWASCAGVYINKTGKSLVIKGTDMFQQESSKAAGYFTIDKNGVVLKSNANVSYTDISETLQDGDGIVYLRYLDGLISGNTMYPATSVTVGSNVEVKSYTFDSTKTDADYAQEVIVQIDGLPESIDVTLKDESLINSVKAAYDALTTTQKALVTNYSKLVEVLSKLNELIKEQEELALAKSNAIKEIQNYVSLDDYGAEYQKLIQNYISKAVSNINNCIDIDSVGRVLALAKSQIDALDTIDVWRTDAIEQVNRFLKKYVETNYTVDNYTKISNYCSNAIIQINSLNEYEPMQEVITQLVKDLDSVPTLLQLKEDTIKKYVTNVKAYITSLAIKAYLQPSIDAIYDKNLNEYTSLDTTTIINQYEKYLKIAKDAIESFYNSINVALTTALKTIADWTSNVENLDALKSEYTTKVNSAVTVEEINTIVATFKEVAKNVEPEKTGCKKSAYFFEILTSVALLAFVFKKREE